MLAPGRVRGGIDLADPRRWLEQVEVSAGAFGRHARILQQYDASDPVSG